MKQSNILVSLLRDLGVKYTDSYATKLYQMQPFRNSLLGISESLNKYGIENVSISVDRKEDIQKVEPPFVAVIDNEFVLIKNECPHVTKMAKFKLPNCPTGMFWNTLCKI